MIEKGKVLTVAQQHLHDAWLQSAFLHLLCNTNRFEECQPEDQAVKRYIKHDMCNVPWKVRLDEIKSIDIRQDVQLERFYSSGHL